MATMCTPVGPDMQKAIVKKHLQNVRNSEIERQFGIHRSTVGRILKTYAETGKNS